MHAVTMPMLGNTMETGLLVEWKIEAESEVTEGDILALVESEKTTGEVTSRQDGTLARVDVEPGDEVPPGTVIGVVLGPDESLDDAPAPRAQLGESTESDADPAGPDGSSETVATGAGESAEAEAGGEESPVGAATEDTSDSSEHPPSAEEQPEASVRASPSTRRLARELGVNLASIEGGGVGGRVTAQDVRQAAADGYAADEEPSPGGETSQKTTPQTVTIAEETPLRGTRATIARRMTQSYQEVPHVTLNRTVDVTQPLRAVGELDESVGFTDLLVVAVGQALVEHPQFNAWFKDGTVRRIEEVNIAVAVDTDRGLLTPVVREVTDRPVTSVAADRRELSEAALTGQLSQEELMEGTFTISNLGPLGVESFDPIINPPQVAILGVGAAVDGECTLSLSFDHRVVDGAGAARFLDTLAGHVEAPTGLLMERADRRSTGPAMAGPSEPSSESAEKPLESLAGRVERSLTSALDEVVSARGWPRPTISVSFEADETPTIRAKVPSGANPATIKRAIYASCRESDYAGYITGLRDPKVMLEPEHSTRGTETSH